MNSWMITTHRYIHFTITLVMALSFNAKPPILRFLGACIVMVLSSVAAASATSGRPPMTPSSTNIHPAAAFVKNFRRSSCKLLSSSQSSRVMRSSLPELLPRFGRWTACQEVGPPPAGSAEELVLREAGADSCEKPRTSRVRGAKIAKRNARGIIMIGKVYCTLTLLLYVASFSLSHQSSISIHHPIAAHRDLQSSPRHAEIFFVNDDVVTSRCESRVS